MSAPLDDDPTQLRARIGELAAELAKERQEKAKLLEANEQLKLIVARFRHMIHGRRSERMADQPGQGKLPFAVEEEPPMPPPPHVAEAPDEEHKGEQKEPRARGVRRQRSDLPRVRTVIELLEDQRLCTCS